MKTPLLFLFILISNVAVATVRTLNNNHPSPGQFTTWTAVHSASVSGDTIYISGSPISYGSIVIELNNLTIIGTGHHPNKQEPLVSDLTYINAIDINSLTLNGLRFNSAFLSWSFTNSPPTLKVENCYVYERISIQSIFTDVNLKLHNNILNSNLSSFGSMYDIAILASIDQSKQLKGDISNNIIVGTISCFKISDPSGARISDCFITNNIFIAHGIFVTDVFKYQNIYNNSIFSNNILLGYQHHGLDTNSNVLCQNNVIFPVAFPTSLPNQSNTQIANPLFVNYGCGGNWDCAYNSIFDFHLQSGSPCLGSGTNGFDIGPYGGPHGSKFSVSGEPQIPQIKQMDIPTTVISGQSFNVNIISTAK